MDRFWSMKNSAVMGMEMSAAYTTALPGTSSRRWPTNQGLGDSAAAQLLLSAGSNEMQPAVAALPLAVPL